MKRIITTLAILIMAVTSWADTTNVKYLDANGEEQTCSSATIVTSSDEHVTWEAGWYVVLGEDVTLSKAVECSGDVHLILAEGSKLTVNCISGYGAALFVGPGHTLEIYGQAYNAGTLIATSNIAYCAGIGGSGDIIIINGGTIQAKGGTDAAGIGAGYGSVANTGISREDVGTITINGGNITATGGDDGAGIGTGWTTGSVCWNININGGNITAIGGTQGAGIGRGSNGKCPNININGGDIYAVAGTSGYMAIRAYESAENFYGNLKFGEYVTVYSDANADPTTLIYDSKTSFSTDKMKQYARVTPKIKYIDAAGTEQTCSTATVVTSSADHVEWAAGWYVVKNGSDITLSDGVDCTGDVHLILEDNSKLTINTTSNDRTAIWIGENNNLQIYGQSNNSGKLIATSLMKCAAIGGKGISLVINGGTIQAKGGSYAAGIGSGMQQTFGTITINGGNVTANGGAEAAGIGSGAGGGCGYITINGGNVTATGGGNSYPAIGKGDGGTCSSIVINKDLFVYAGSSANPSEPVANVGQEDLSSSLSQQYALVSVEPKVRYIDANGNQQTHFAAIITSFDGHLQLAEGWHVVLGDNITIDDGIDCLGDVHLILADGSKLTINASSTRTALWVGENNTLEIYGQANNTGTLIASSGEQCAGIGGTGKALVINGGTIEAHGGSVGVGIGTSNLYDFGDITINGGNITAIGGDSSSGIGGGTTVNNTCGNITINGGNITAIGGSTASAIGNGSGNKCGNITINGGNITATAGGAYQGHQPAAIGKGVWGSCGTVIVNNSMVVLTGSSENPTTWVKNDGGNLLGKFDRYAKVYPNNFSITGSADGGIEFERVGTVSATLEYTKDLSSSSWKEYTFGYTLYLDKDETIYFRGTADTFYKDNNNYISFCSAADVVASGNIMALIDKTCAMSSVPDKAFFGVFRASANSSSTNTNISADIPGYVESIGKYAFENCLDLKSISIPTTVTSINDYAFCCTRLTSVTIPNSVTSIGENVFDGCSSLTSVELPNTITSIPNDLFSDCTNLSSVDIPSSVTTIGSFAFENCKGLTSVTIPNTVKTIGNHAFYCCEGLTSLVIPKSVTSLNEAVFDGCSKLNIIFKNIEPCSIIADSYVFMNVKTLKVPVGTSATYLAGANWSEYQKKITESIEAGALLDESVDNTSVIPAAVGDNVDVTLKRTLKTTNWNTFSLPVSLDADQVNSIFGEGTEIAKLSGNSDDIVYFSTTDATITANEPVLIKPATVAEGGLYCIEGATVVDGTPKVTKNNVSLIGNYAPITGDQGTNTYYLKNSTFYQTQYMSTMKPFRAYLEIVTSDAPAPQRFAVEFDSSTGIESIDVESDNNTPAYNLQGQRVNGNAKGIVIKNGKKYFNK